MEEEIGKKIELKPIVKMIPNSEEALKIFNSNLEKTKKEDKPLIEVMCFSAVQKNSKTFEMLVKASQKTPFTIIHTQEISRDNEILKELENINKNNRIISIPLNKLRVSHLPPNKEWWSDIFYIGGVMWYLHPHSPEPKIHTHIGYIIEHSEAQKEFMEIINKLKKFAEDYSQHKNTKIFYLDVDEMINNLYFRLYYKELYDLYKNKWILLVNGGAYSKVFEDLDILYKGMNKDINKKIIPIDSHKLIWKMGMEEVI